MSSRLLFTLAIYFSFSLSRHWESLCGNENLLKWSSSSIQKAGLCADHFNKEDFISRTKLHIGRNPIPWIPKDTGISPAEDNNESVTEETITIEEIVQENVVDHSDDRDYTPMEVDIHTDFQVERDIAKTTKNDTNEEVATITMTTRKKCYPSGKELFCNFGNDCANDDEWLDNRHPFSLFVDNYSQAEVGMKANMLKKRKEKPQKKSASQKMKSKDELSEIEKLKKENLKLKKLLLQRKKKTRNTTAMLQRRNTAARKKKNVCKHSVSEFLNGKKCQKPLARTMIKLQLHEGTLKYTKEEKDIAKQMFYYSASGYSRMRKAGLNLPSESSVRSWISETEIRPGFCEEIFSKIQESLSKLPPSQRVCCLKFDEMSIKKFEEYSRKYDLIEGLIDLGPFGRSNEPAVHVLLFCLDSINAENPWRQIVAYFLTGRNSTHKEIVQLTEICLEKLKNIGASVQLITCDQGGQNRKAFNNWKISPHEPFFSLNNETYFTSFDWPHLIKRLISQLRSHKYIYVNGEIIMSFHDLFSTWQLDRKLNTSNLLSHITYAHFYPNNFEAMNVKRAFQMLSARFAAAISTAGQSNELKSTSWKASADFVYKMNKVIDAMNVYHLSDWKGEKGPLSDVNTVAEELLISFIEWSSKWSTSPNKISRPPCFDGIITTVQAILSMYRSIKQYYPNFKLATALCNQDSVEHTFGKVRGRGGFNRNPTARMVRLTLRHIISSGCIYGSSRSNVICPETSSLIDGTSVVHEMETNNVPLQEELIFPIEMDNDDCDDDLIAFEEITKYSEQNDNLIMNMTDKNNFNFAKTYEGNAIAFFAGYVARYGYKNTKCDSCRETNMKTPMEESNDNEIYIQLREYEHEDEDGPTVQWLSRPTDAFLNIVTLQLEALNSCYKKYCHFKDLKKKLLEICVKYVQHADEHWFDQNIKCYPHRIQMLDFILRVKIYAITKKNNNGGKEGINTVASGGSKEIKTKCQKLKNIKHM